jgi:hypothetical protein
MIPGDRKNRTWIRSVLRIELSILHQRLISCSRVVRILVFVYDVAEVKQKRGKRCVSASAADIWVGDLRGHGFSDLQPGKTIGEIPGAANRMKAHNACLLYVVRHVGINMLELHVMSCRRRDLRNRRPNSMLHARRVRRRSAGVSNGSGMSLSYWQRLLAAHFEEACLTERLCVQ